MYNSESRSLNDNELKALSESKTKKSKKTVFANAMLCHVWANQSQESGRNSSDTLYFNGDSIYSYGQHYLAGRIYTKKDGTKFALVNSYNYSMATSGHLSDIRSALRGKMPYYSVPNVKEFNCAENIEHVEKYILESIGDIYNYRKKHYRDANIVIERLRENIKDANDTLLAMGAPLFNLTEVQWNAIRDVLESKLAVKASIVADPNRFEKNKKAWIRKNQERIDFANNFKEVTREEAIEKFRKFEITDISTLNSIPYKMIFNYKERAKLVEFGIEVPSVNYYYNDLSLDNEILRVNVTKGIVETSRGANVPLEHAIRALKLIKSGKDKAIKLGHFEIDNINDGIVKIGCHRILLSEAEAVLAPFMNKSDASLTLVQE